MKKTFACVMVYYMLIVFVGTCCLAYSKDVGEEKLRNTKEVTDESMEQSDETEPEATEKVYVTSLEHVGGLPSAKPLTMVSRTVYAKPMSSEAIVSVTTRQVQIAEETKAELEVVYVMYYTEKDVIAVAKTIYKEAGGVPSQTEKSAVAWCICNRKDYTGTAYRCDNESIFSVTSEPHQFAYYPDTEYTEECYWIAADVLERWNREKNGETNVGRTLPAEYIFFTGDGKHNHFRKDVDVFRDYYDWSLPSPYEN